MRLLKFDASRMPQLYRTRKPS